MNKYNNEKKLKKEAEIKDSGDSKCVIARPGLSKEKINGRPFTLADF